MSVYNYPNDAVAMTADEHRAALLAIVAHLQKQHPTAMVNDYRGY